MVQCDVIGDDYTHRAFYTVSAGLPQVYFLTLASTQYHEVSLYKQQDVVQL